MTLKIGLMHTPKPVIRFNALAAADYALRRPVATADCPMELLVRLREARRRMRRGWKGAEAT